jgi:hypothetical protein
MNGVSMGRQYMASKRKTLEKKNRAAKRREQWEKVIAEQVADRLLGIKRGLRVKVGYWKLYGTEVPRGN